MGPGLKGYVWYYHARQRCVALVDIILKILYDYQITENNNILRSRMHNRIKLLGIGLLLALCIVVSPVLADPSLSTDKADYVPLDTVVITGAGFAPGNPVTLIVTRPDKTTKTTFTEYPNASGAFIVEYVIDFQVGNNEGTYTVEAMDSASNIITHITFTDTVPPPPVPEFPTVALPVGMMIGIAGLVLLVKSREN
jgi:hypothetical protein